MAIRPVFIADLEKNNKIKEVNVNFNWFAGFSVQQKQKSIEALHEEFAKRNPDSKVLEISSKSNDPIGVSLSAFNLSIKTKNEKEFTVETAFQSSKVFEKGGPYIDLLKKSSREAKKDERLKQSGNLLYFQYFKRKWPLEPKTLFYDWLYINAVSLNKDLSEKILEYNAFTDIEFNPNKSINCQARSAALYVSLYKLGLLDAALSSNEKYIHLLGNDKKNGYFKNKPNMDQPKLF